MNLPDTGYEVAWAYFAEHQLDEPLLSQQEAIECFVRAALFTNQTRFPSTLEARVSVIERDVVLIENFASEHFEKFAVVCRQRLPFSKMAPKIAAEGLRAAFTNNTDFCYEYMRRLSLRKTLASEIIQDLDLAGAQKLFWELCKKDLESQTDKKLFQKIFPKFIGAKMKVAKDIDITMSNWALSHSFACTFFQNAKEVLTMQLPSGNAVFELVFSPQAQIQFLLHPLVESDKNIGRHLFRLIKRLHTCMEYELVVMIQQMKKPQKIAAFSECCRAYSDDPIAQYIFTQMLNSKRNGSLTKDYLIDLYNFKLTDELRTVFIELWITSMGSGFMPETCVPVCYDLAIEAIRQIPLESWPNKNSVILQLLLSLEANSKEFIDKISHPDKHTKMFLDLIKKGMEQNEKQVRMAVCKAIRFLCPDFTPESVNRLFPR